MDKVGLVLEQFVDAFYYIYRLRSIILSHKGISLFSCLI